MVLRLSIVLASLVLTWGCATLQAQSPLLEELEHSRMSASELRARVRALALPFSGELEVLADEIAARSDDPQTLVDMTRFKINAIPQLQVALLRHDPVVALIDAWALVVQLEQALSQRAPLDDVLRPRARKTFRELDARLAGLWGELTQPDKVAEVRQRIQRWAQENPLQDSLAARPSTVSLFTAVTQGSGVKLLRIPAELNEAVEDLTTRVDLYATYLPKQAGWQAQQVSRALVHDPTLAGDTTVSELLGSVAALSATAERLPTLLDSQLDEVLTEVRDERLALQQFIREERRAVFDGIARERAIVLDQSFERTQRLLDRLFLRVLLLLALAVAGAALLLHLWRGGRSRPEPSEPAARKSPAAAS